MLARALGGRRVGVHATHPGWADTPGVVESLPRFHRLTGPLLRDAAGGADTTVWLAATDPQPPGRRAVARPAQPAARTCCRARGPTSRNATRCGTGSASRPASTP